MVPAERFQRITRTTLAVAGVASLVLSASTLAAQQPGPRAFRWQYGVDLLGLELHRDAFPADSEPTFDLRTTVAPPGGFRVQAVAIPLRRLADLHLHARISNVERNRFYGLGNLTEAPFSTTYYKLEQLAVEVGAELSGATSLFGGVWSIGPVFKALNTESDVEAAQQQGHPDELDDGGVIKTLQPYGAGLSRQLGVRARFEGGRVADRRERLPTGWWVRVDAEAYPAWLDLHSPLSTVSAEFRAALSLPHSTTVVFRAGGRRVFGDLPFHEAAYLGGRRSLRGFQKQRFAGDAALYASTVMHLPGRLLAIGARRVFVGPLAVADMGRVSYEGSSPGGWHLGAGGGMWLREAGSRRYASVTLVRGGAGLRAYVGVGFPIVP